MIINARGRRALPLTFSPDVHHYTPPRGSSMGNQRTISKLAIPNGGIARLLLPTRTSPRKRLTLTDSPPTSMAAPLLTSTPSPEQRFLKKSPAAGGKKTKTDDFLATNNTNADKEAHLSTPVLPCSLLKVLPTCSRKYDNFFHPYFGEQSLISPKDKPPYQLQKVFQFG